MTCAALLATLLAGASARQASGQYLPERRVTAGVVGSIASPAGDLSEVADRGFGVTALFQVTRGFLGARGELGYTSLGGGRVAAPAGEVDAPDVRILSGVVSAVLGAGTLRGVVRPYLIAGVGVYRFGYGEADAGDTLNDYATRTDLGVNAGLAVRFPLGPFTALVESRLHHVFGDARRRVITPIGFGITF